MRAPDAIRLPPAFVIRDNKVVPTTRTGGCPPPANLPYWQKKIVPWVGADIVVLDKRAKGLRATVHDVYQTPDKTWSGLSIRVSLYNTVAGIREFTVAYENVVEEQ